MADSSRSRTGSLDLTPSWPSRSISGFSPWHTKAVAGFLSQILLYLQCVPVVPRPLYLVNSSAARPELKIALPQSAAWSLELDPIRCSNSTGYFLSCATHDTWIACVLPGGVSCKLAVSLPGTLVSVSACFIPSARHICGVFGIFDLVNKLYSWLYDFKMTFVFLFSVSMKSWSQLTRLWKSLKDSFSPFLCRCLGAPCCRITVPWKWEGWKWCSGPDLA